MPGKRRRDDRDPWGIRNPRNYLDARYGPPPSNDIWSFDPDRLFNPQEYMGRGLRRPQHREVAWYHNGRYYTRAQSGIQRLGENLPDWRYYAVHNDRYDL